MDTPPPRETLQMASLRLEALGDGIFSIAMTILAVELAVPVVNGTHWEDFGVGLRHISRDLLCYVISFLVLGIMWFGHRMMFEYIGRSNRTFIFLGILFYLMVCLVPFSTRILAANTLQWFAILMYAVNLSLCNLALYSQWLYGIHRKTLLHSNVPLEVKKEANILFLLSPVVYGIAIAFGFFMPKVSISIFIITPLLYFIPNKLDKYLP
jgi:uncharacterized membrane protein